MLQFNYKIKNSIIAKCLSRIQNDTDIQMHKQTLEKRQHLGAVF